MIQEDGTKKPIRHKFLFLTYSKFLDKKYTNYLEETRLNSLSNAVYCSGFDDEGYECSWVLLDFGDTIFRSSKADVFDYKGIRPLIQPTKGTDQGCMEKLVYMDTKRLQASTKFFYKGDRFKEICEIKFPEKPSLEERLPRKVSKDMIIDPNSNEWCAWYDEYSGILSESGNKISWFYSDGINKSKDLLINHYRALLGRYKCYLLNYTSFYDSIVDLMKYSGNLEKRSMLLINMEKENHNNRMYDLVRGIRENKIIGGAATVTFVNHNFKVVVFSDFLPDEGLLDSYNISDYMYKIPENPRDSLTSTKINYM